MESMITRQRLVRGVRWFGALTVAGLGALFVVSGGGTLAVVRGLSVPFLLLAAAAAVLDLAIGAGRYHIFLRRIRKGSPFTLPLRADLANRFMGALTPSQTGGGPAQLFILHQGGVAVAEALPFLAINFLSTMLFFLVAGGFTAWTLRGTFPQGAVSVLLTYGFAAFALLGGVVFVTLVRPDLVERPCRAWVARHRARPSRRSAALERVGTWAVENLGRYRAVCARFMREEPLLLVWSFLLTALLYANKFTLGWLILRGLGVEAGYAEVLAIQTVLQFILFVAPSPGGSGIAELTTATLMARFLPPEFLGVFTLVFRFFLLYLPAALGCLVVLAALKPRGGPLPGAAVAHGGGVPSTT